ncbi:MAG: hypothetical protein HY689_04150 [Chloroflexi bacterium]|nr:hypothetical protein [Chloroflexota bacterium]
MVKVHYVSPDEFQDIAREVPFTREYLCPKCGKFLVTKLVESRAYPEERRCLAECAAGHRFIAPYD